MTTRDTSENGFFIYNKNVSETIITVRDVVKKNGNLTSFGGASSENAGSGNVIYFSL